MELRESKIFASWSLIVFLIIQILALYMLLRGHNSPGGGFVGGLAASISFVLLSLSQNYQHVNYLIKTGITIGGIGLLLSFSTGFIPIFFALPYLTHFYTPIPTTFWFDLGIYLIVCSISFSFFIQFRETILGVEDNDY